MHGFQIFLFLMVITLFLRNNIYSLAYMGVLLCSALYSSPKILQHFGWIGGFVMVTVILQYIFLVNLPPVLGLAWPWTQWSLTVVNLDIMRWCALVFNPWELACDFFLLL